jgi:hypothetical protein
LVGRSARASGRGGADLIVSHRSQIDGLQTDLVFDELVEGSALLSEYLLQARGEIRTVG